MRGSTVKIARRQSVSSVRGGDISVKAGPLESIANLFKTLKGPSPGIEQTQCLSKVEEFHQWTVPCQKKKDSMENKQGIPSVLFLWKKITAKSLTCGRTTCIHKNNPWLGWVTSGGIRVKGSE